MKRIITTPRQNWRQRCDAVGFSFYDLESEGGRPYWNESAAYVFTPEEITVLEQATQEVFDRCMDACEFIVRNRRFKEFAIPPEFWDAVAASWDNDDPTVYGRFDFAFDSDNGHTPKLLEFNADTPTSLVESAAAQWQWLQDVYGQNADQFNSLHEQLIDQWQHIRTQRWAAPASTRLHLASLHNDGDGNLITEDFDTIAYMAETAKAAGFDPKLTFIEDIGWDEEAERFVDIDGEPINHIFKLYPWEWLANERMAPHILQSSIQWVEPLWKMLLSNKQLLVVLHELFPDHPNLLPAYSTPAAFKAEPYVKKPKLSREGANIEIYGADKQLIEKGKGDYGVEGYVYQALTTLPRFDSKNLVIGSWVVGDSPAGIDMRETSTLITGNLAEFVPHFIEPMTVTTEKK